MRRFPSLLVQNFLHSPVYIRPSNINPFVVPLFDRAISRFVFFSTDSGSRGSSNIDEIVSKEELKRRIQSFMDDGNEDALPELFEAMMIRKLSGKHDDDSDDEVMEVVRKYPLNDAPKVVDDTDSDFENDSSDSDNESDGQSVGDSSDSDIENHGLRDGDSFASDINSNGSSDSDIEFDGLKNIKITIPKDDQRSLVSDVFHSCLVLSFGFH